MYCKRASEPRDDDVGIGKSRNEMHLTEASRSGPSWSVQTFGTVCDPEDSTGELDVREKKMNIVLSLCTCSTHSTRLSPPERERERLP